MARPESKKTGKSVESPKQELLAKIQILGNHGLKVPDSVTSAIARAAAQ